MMSEQDGGEWYADGEYVRNHRRAVALAHCQDESVAERIVTDHNAALASAERVRELTEALENVRQYALTIVGASEAYGETESAHLWQEVADMVDAALTAPAAAADDPMPRIPPLSSVPVELEITSVEAGKPLAPDEED